MLLSHVNCFVVKSLNVFLNRIHCVRVFCWYYFGESLVKRLLINPGFEWCDCS